MNWRFRLLLPPLLAFTMCFTGAAEDRASASQSTDVSGEWQVAWQARLGAEQVTVQFHQEGEKLSGTFEDLHGTQLLTGSIQGKQLLFEVSFKGPHSYTIGFSGKVDGDKMTGTSQAKNVGTAGAYLGHGGEVVQPEHPWTAQRLAKQTTQSGPNSNPPAKN